MGTTIATFSVTDLRHRTKAVLKETRERGYSFIVRRSKPAVAIVDPEYFAALQEAHEDYLDVLEYDVTIGLPRISFFEHKKRRKA